VSLNINRGLMGLRASPSLTLVLTDLYECGLFLGREVQEPSRFSVSSEERQGFLVRVSVGQKARAA
jgi:hypothetical protein